MLASVGSSGSTSGASSNSSASSPHPDPAAAIFDPHRLPRRRAAPFPAAGGGKEGSYGTRRRCGAMAAYGEDGEAPSPPPGPGGGVNVFANDGSFLELFKRKMEELPTHSGAQDIGAPAGRGASSEPPDSSRKRRPPFSGKLGVFGASSPCGTGGPGVGSPPRRGGGGGAQCVS
uniref:Uncharacterized protein n=1 Tax=Dromaius novaehollandiae TaxID=8790 RepID=A0A8C4JNS0_DRONO